MTDERNFDSGVKEIWDETVLTDEIPFSGANSIIPVSDYETEYIPHTSENDSLSTGDRQVSDDELNCATRSVISDKTTIENIEDCHSTDEKQESVPSDVRSDSFSSHHIQQNEAPSVNDNGLAAIDEVINDSVESAIKKVIEDSVQQVLCSKAQVDRQILEALSITVEESLTDMICKLNMEDKTQKDLEQSGEEMEEADHELCAVNAQSSEKVEDGNGCSDCKSIVKGVRPKMRLNVKEGAEIREHLLRNVSDSNSVHNICDNSQVKNEGKADSVVTIEAKGQDEDLSLSGNRLKSWIEAGKALREALNKYASSSEIKDLKTKNTTTSSITPKINSNTWKCDPTSIILNKDKDKSKSLIEPMQLTSSILEQDSLKENKIGLEHTKSPNSASLTASLTRSMEQSLSDPMNLMWEEFQNTQPRSNNSFNHPYGHPENRSNVSRSSRNGLDIPQNTNNEMHGGGDASHMGSMLNSSLSQTMPSPLESQLLTDQHFSSIDKDFLPNGDNLFLNCSGDPPYPESREELSLSESDKDTALSSPSRDQSLSDSNKDPTLSELRERMRQLVSNLPIATNQSPVKESVPSTVPDVGLRKHRSPKNLRRRHLRICKETEIAISDEESEDLAVSGPRSPPKYSKVAHKTGKSGVKTGSEAQMCKEHGIDKTSQDQLKTELICVHPAPQSNENNPFIDGDFRDMPDLVSESESDLEDNPSSVQEDVCDKTGRSNCQNNSSHTRTCTKAINSDIQKASSSSEKESNLSQTSKTAGSSPITQTESMCNFADIESTGSERERLSHDSYSENQVGNHDPYNRGELIGKIDIDSSTDSMPSLESLSAGEQELASALMIDKCQQKIRPKVPDKQEDDSDYDDLFDDMPELVMSSASSPSDDSVDITLSCKDWNYLQDCLNSDSSPEEDDVEADDEFECECNLCQFPRNTGLEEAEDTPDADENQLGLRYLEDLSEEFQNYRGALDPDDDLDSPLGDLSSTLSPLGLLISQSYRRDFLNLMFTNVIMHMLSVYPDLLNDATPPPVPDVLFESFAVVTVGQAHLDEERSCPVCLCSFELAEKVKQLPCQHLFHPLCIQAWIQKAGTCPLCRFNLTNIPGTPPST